MWFEIGFFLLVLMVLCNIRDIHALVKTNNNADAALEKLRRDVDRLSTHSFSTALSLDKIMRALRAERGEHWLNTAALMKDVRDIGDGLCIACCDSPLMKHVAGSDVEDVGSLTIDGKLWITLKSSVAAEAIRRASGEQQGGEQQA